VTIDERLEKLAERHEALAQTVDILSHDVRQQYESIQVLAKNSQTLHDSIQGLVRIAEIHERRITDLEE